MAAVATVYTARTAGTQRRQGLTARRQGSSKLRKLCARWAVIAAKTLVMMTLSAVFLSVLPIKNLYKAAAKLPGHEPRQPCSCHHQTRHVPPSS